MVHRLAQIRAERRSPAQSHRASPADSPERRPARLEPEGRGRAGVGGLLDGSGRHRCFDRHDRLDRRRRRHARWHRTERVRHGRAWRRKRCRRRAEIDLLGRRQAGGERGLPGRQRRLRHGLVDERVDHVGAAASRAATALRAGGMGAWPAVSSDGGSLVSAVDAGAAVALGLHRAAPPSSFLRARLARSDGAASASGVGAGSSNSSAPQEIDQGLLLCQTRLGLGRGHRAAMRWLLRRPARARAGGGGGRLLRPLRWRTTWLV